MNNSINRYFASLDKNVDGFTIVKDKKKECGKSDMWSSIKNMYGQEVLLNLNLKKFLVKGDGDCLWTSVKMILEKYGTIATVDCLKRIFVHEMKSIYKNSGHPKYDLVTGIINAMGLDINNIDKHLRKGHWNDQFGNFALQFVQFYYNINIIVLQNNKKPIVIGKIDWNKSLNYVWYNGGHYDAVVRK